MTLNINDYKAGTILELDIKGNKQLYTIVTTNSDTLNSDKSSKYLVNINTGHISAIIKYEVNSIEIKKGGLINSTIEKDYPF